jgi:hypothetical protein
MYHQTLEFEDQLITPGFAGRLLRVSPVEKPQNISNRSFEISLTPAYQAIPDFISSLHAEAKEIGVNLKVRFDQLRERDVGNAVMRLRLFKGNMSDARGSWGYLLSSPLAGIPNTSKSAYRIDGDLDPEIAHSKVLEEKWAIPFFREKTPTFHSRHVDISNWNPMDSRLRLYEVDIK